MKRLLICRTDAIGDLILTLPIARSIKENHPDLHLTMLVSDYTSGLLLNENYLDKIMTIPGRSVRTVAELKKLAESLMQQRFDTTLVVYPRLGLALATLLAGIDLRVGTAYRSYSFLFNKTVRLHRRDSGMHELDLNYALAESVFPDLPRREPQLIVSSEQVNAARDLVRTHGVKDNDSYVVIHPLSRGSAPNWRLASYLDLADRIAEEGLTPVVTGSSSERERLLTAMVRRDMVHPVVAGETDLPTLLGLIKSAAAVVTGSTGPIHIATAVGTFAVGIYPPQSALSATRWGPRGGANKLFVPIVESKGADARDCMDRVTVDEVAAYLLSKCRDAATL